MENFGEELNSKKREFGRNMVFSLLSIFLLYIALFLWLKKNEIHLPAVIPVSFLVICFAATAYIGYIFTKTTFSFRALYTIVAVSFFALIFYLSLLLCHVSSAIYYFYIPILLLVFIISDVKTTAIAATCIFLLSIFTKQIAEFLNISADTPVPPKYAVVLRYLEFIEIFIVGYLSFFMLYYYVKINKIKNNIQETIVVEDAVPQIQTPETLPLKITASQTETEKPAVEEKVPKKRQKIDDLYQKIINSFENEKPYQCPQFSLSKMAEMLNSNTTYISMAMNRIGNKKFSHLVNEYRIQQVKDEISENLHHKFTIEHIYIKAGFTQQSTFNRIFKEYTGMTPSDFIEWYDGAASAGK